MAADKIKIEIDADTRKAISELNKLQKAEEGVEKGADKARISLQSIDDKLTGFTEVVKEARETMAGWVTGLANFAVRIEQQERAIARLGSAYDSVLVATNGAISAQQAFTLRGQIQAAGIQVNDRALSALTRAAREYADATGNDASEAIEKLTNAIVNNSEDALSEMNLAMARSTSGAQTLTNVVAELERRFAGTAPPARTLAQDIERLPAAFDAMGAAMLRSVEGPLARLFESMTNITGVSVSLRQAVREIADAGDTIRAVDRQQQQANEDNARQTAREQLINRARTLGVQVPLAEINRLNTRQITRLQQQLETAAGLQGNARGRTGDINAAFASVTNLGGASLLQEAFGGALGMIQQDAEREQRAAERRAGTTNNRVLSEMEAGIERKQRKPSSATSTDNTLRTARDAFAAAAAEAMERNAVLVTVDDMPRQPGETLAAYFNRLADLQREFNTMGAINDLAPTNEAELQTEREKGEAAFAEERAGTERDRARTQRIAARDRETRRRARTESFGGELASALGYETDEEGRIKELDVKKAGVGLMRDAVQTLQGNLSELFGTIVSGSTSAADAFQLFASRTLSSLGEMAMNKGLFYTFEGIAALFSNPPAAPLYFAAGAGLLALGAGLGLAGSAIKPQAPAPGAGSDLGAARGLAPRSASLTESSGLGGVTVVMSSLVPAGPADAQRVRDGQRHASRMGFGDRVPRRVEF